MRDTDGVLLVAYDIPDDKRRRKVARELTRFGVRVQYSVFLVTRGTAKEVAQSLQPLIVDAEDDVRIHPLCRGCLGKAVLLGQAREAGLPAGFRVV